MTGKHGGHAYIRGNARVDRSCVFLFRDGARVAHCLSCIECARVTRVTRVDFGVCNFAVGRAGIDDGLRRFGLFFRFWYDDWFARTCRIGLVRKPPTPTELLVVARK